MKDDGILSIRRSLDFSFFFMAIIVFVVICLHTQAFYKEHVYKGLSIEDVGTFLYYVEIKLIGDSGAEIIGDNEAFEVIY